MHHQQQLRQHHAASAPPHPHPHRRDSHHIGQPRPQANASGKSSHSSRRHVSNPTSNRHKNYVSENDMPTEHFDPSFQHSHPAPPCTPNKRDTTSVAPWSNRPNPKSSTQTKRKTYPAPLSPSTQYESPPGVPARTPDIESAFAGASFQSSPAASSLPVPKFFHNAMNSPSARAAKTPRSTMPSPPPTDSEAQRSNNLSQDSAMPTPCAHEESPLDIFFRADRAEKEKARSAMQLQLHSPPFSPQSDTTPPPPGPGAATDYMGPASPQSDMDFFNITSHGTSGGDSRNRPPMSTGPSAPISPSSLNYHASTRPHGPALSRPYSDRMKEARANRQPKQAPKPHHSATAPATIPAAYNYSDPNLPFSQHGRLVRSSMGRAREPGRSLQPLIAQALLNSKAPPTLPMEDKAEKPADLLSIEESMRRILNLESRT